MSREGITLHIEGRDIFIPADSIASARVLGWDLQTTQSPNMDWAPNEHPSRPPRVVPVVSKMTGKLQVTLEFDLQGGNIMETGIFTEIPSNQKQLPNCSPLLSSPDRA